MENRIIQRITIIPLDREVRFLFPPGFLEGQLGHVPPVFRHPITLNTCIFHLSSEKQRSTFVMYAQMLCICDSWSALWETSNLLGQVGTGTRQTAASVMYQNHETQKPQNLTATVLEAAWVCDESLHLHCLSEFKDDRNKSESSRLDTLQSKINRRASIYPLSAFAHLYTRVDERNTGTEKGAD